MPAEPLERLFEGRKATLVDRTVRRSGVGESHRRKLSDRGFPRSTVREVQPSASNGLVEIFVRLAAAAVGADPYGPMSRGTARQGPPMMTLSTFGGVVHATGRDTMRGDTAQFRRCAPGDMATYRALLEARPWDAPSEGQGRLDLSFGPVE